MAGASSPLTEWPLFFFRQTHSIRTFTFFMDEMQERGRCGMALGVGRKELVMVGVLLVGVRVKLVEPGGIERSTGKTKHVEDLRK